MLYRTKIFRLSILIQEFYYYQKKVCFISTDIDFFFSAKKKSTLLYHHYFFYDKKIYIPKNALRIIWMWKFELRNWIKKRRKKLRNVGRKKLDSLQLRWWNFQQDFGKKSLMLWLKTQETRSQEKKKNKPKIYIQSTIDFSEWAHHIIFNFFFFFSISPAPHKKLYFLSLFEVKERSSTSRRCGAKEKN